MSFLWFLLSNVQIQGLGQLGLDWNEFMRKLSQQFHLGELSAEQNDRNDKSGSPDDNWI